MKRYPGQVWYLPPELEAGGDPKVRRHVLLTECAEDEGGVCSFASTQPTEARFGAACLHVDPATSPDVNPGFTRPTYVYASRLVQAAPRDFLRIAGRLDHEMPHLRALLARSLGLGTGASTRNQGWRGRVVELSARRREIVGCGYGVVLTEEAYSRSRRYQLIVPMDDVRVFEPEPDDLVVSSPDWLRQIPLTNALAVVADVQSVFHPLDIDSWTGAVVDDETLAEIETRLTKLFEL